MKKIILLFAFIFPTILMAQLNTDLGHLYPGEEVVIKTQDDWGKENYKKVINEFKNDPLKLGEIVFLGNSITAGGGNWSLRLDHPNIKNRGIGGDTTDGVLARLDEIIYFQPEAVFLLIGINDLWNNTLTDSFVNNVGENIIEIAKTIVKKSPKTKMFVQTVLPIGKQEYIEPIKNLNDIIKSNAEFYNVIDLYVEFINEKGLMQEELTTDGVHLNEKGYQKWVETVKPVFYSFKKKSKKPYDTKLF